MQFNKIASTRRVPRALRALAEAVEPRRLLAAVSWDGGGDGVSWNDPNNWSANALPVVADDVTINVGANPTILLFGAGASVNSLNSSEALQITTTLTVATTTTLNAPTRISSAGNLAAYGNVTTNDVLTLGSAIDSTYGVLYFYGQNDVTLGGTGSVVSSGTATEYIYNYTYDNTLGTGKKLTIGSGIEITLGSAYFYSAYNSGTVQLDGPLTLNAPLNSQIGQSSTRFINNSTITATGGAIINSYNLVNNATKSISLTDATLNLYGDAAATPFSWDNNGTIHSNNSIVNFRGTFSLADTGTVTRINGDEVNIAGTLDLAGGTLTLDAAKGSWGLISGGRIKNGSIARTGANTLLVRAGTLDNITLNLPVSVNSYGTLTIENGLVLNDILTIGGIDNTYGVLQFVNNVDQTLSGTGGIASLGVSPIYIYNSTYDSSTGFGKKVTFGSGIEINAVGIIVYSSYSQGVIQNDGPITIAGTASVQFGSNNTRFINNGSITVTGPSTVSTYNLVNNAGKSINLTDTTFHLYGDADGTPYTWDNNGTINANNSIVNMAGTFSIADVGTMVRTNGGQVNVAGTLDLAGGTLTLDNTKGSWGLASGGRIKNGTIARTGTNELIPRGGALDAVTLNLPVTVANYAYLYIENGLVLNDVLTLGDAANTYGVLQFTGTADQTLGGTGSINSISTTTQYIYNYAYETATGFGRKLTVGANIELTLPALSMYTAYQQGILQVDGPITLSGTVASQLGTGTTRFINNGVITVSGASTVNTYNLINNIGRSINLSGATLNLNGDANATPYSWDNNGTINANNSIINMYGTFAVADYGTVVRTNGGQVNIGGVLDLAGSTLTLDNTKGSWGVIGNGRVKNGTITRTGTNEFIPRGGVIDNITLNLPVKVTQYAYLYVENNLVLNDIMTLGDVDNTYGVIQFGGTTNQSITGTGGIVSAGNAAQYVYNYTYDGTTGSGRQLTIGSGIEITGRSFNVYNAYPNGAIVNNGQFIANNVDSNWLIYGTTNGTFTNAGSIQVQDGILELGTLWNNTGTLSVTGGTLRLGGTFGLSNIGTMSHTGGNVHVKGVLDLAGQTLTLDAAKGTWAVINSGVIKNGTIARTGSNILIGQGGLVDNIVLNLPVTVSGANVLNVDHGVTINDTLTLGSSVDNSYGQLYVIGTTDQTIAGTGSIVASGSNYAYFYNNTYDPTTTSGKVVTIGAGIEFTGPNGYFSISYQNGRIHNLGTIGSTVAGGLFQMPLGTTTSFTNAGTIIASNGGETRIAAFTGTAGTLNATGAGSVIDLNGTYDINQATTVGADALLYLRGAWTKSATFDVGGAVVFDYDTAAPSPLNTLYSQLVTGYANGAWNGAGIKSSRALANPGFAVGMASSLQAFSGGGGGTFMNRYVDPTSILARFTRKGDTDINGTVNFDDLLKLAQNYGTTGKVWSQGDFDFNGSVNFDDLLSLAQNYGQSTFTSGRPTTSTKTRSDKFSDVLI